MSLANRECINGDQVEMEILDSTRVMIVLNDGTTITLSPYLYRGSDSILRIDLDRCDMPGRGGEHG